MVEGTNIGQPTPNIVARYVGNETINATIGVAPGPAGPWSYITGVTNSDLDVVAPPPAYLSVAGWAA